MSTCRIWLGGVKLYSVGSQGCQVCGSFCLWEDLKIWDFWVQKGGLGPKRWSYLQLSNEKKGPWLFAVYRGLYYPVMWGL